MRDPQGTTSGPTRGYPAWVFHPPKGVEMNLHFFPMNKHAWVLFACLGILCVMPGSESLWIDEAFVGVWARTPDLLSLWDRLLQDPNSDGQMPFFVLFSWSAARLLGTSEWALRAPNLLWGAIALLGMYRIGRQWNQPWFPLLLILSPFFWFYMNEARPYAMQIGLGSLLAASYSAILAGKNPLDACWAWQFALSGWLLCASTMLGVIPFVVVCAHGIWFILSRRPGVTSGAKIVLGALILLLIPLGIYYWLSLIRGAGGARMWNFGWGSPAMALFEFSGIAGITPSRFEIRELAAGRKWGLLALSVAGPALVLGTGYLALAVAGWKTRKAPATRAALALLSICGTSLILLTCLAMLVQWPFWGRHLAPAFPFFIVACGLLASSGWQAGSAWMRLVLGLTATALLASSLLLRFAPWHKKDDYRAASLFAADALRRGQTVWWCAAPVGAEYYGIPWHPAERGAVNAFGLNSDSLKTLPAPSLVVLSKPDISDKNRVVRELVESGEFRVVATPRAFTVFEFKRQCRRPIDNAREPSGLALPLPRPAGRL